MTDQQQAKKLRFYARWARAFWFGVKRHWRMVIPVLVIVLGAGILYYFWYLKALLPQPDPTELVLTALERLSIVLTLVVAILLGVTELAQNWENSLTKRLTVKFAYQENPEYEMVCRYAYLAHEADIRNWGQQIGSQMAGGERVLVFDPNLDLEVGRPASICGQIFKPYTVTFMLTKLPQSFEKHENLRRVAWEYNFYNQQFDKKCVVLDNGQEKTIPWQEIFGEQGPPADKQTEKACQPRTGERLVIELWMRGRRSLPRLRRAGRIKTKGLSHPRRC